jgi:hypothetical protein
MDATLPRIFPEEVRVRRFWATMLLVREVHRPFDRLSPHLRLFYRPWTYASGGLFDPPNKAPEPTPTSVTSRATE